MKFWGFSRMHELSREPISVSYECVNSWDEPEKPMSRLNYKIPIFSSDGRLGFPLWMATLGSSRPLLQ